MKYTVVIKSFIGDYEKRMQPVSSERIAEKIERGANINLNHEEYYTEIEKVEE
jgi:hypothetical protein